MSMLRHPYPGGGRRSAGLARRWALAALLAPALCGQLAFASADPTAPVSDAVAPAVATPVGEPLQPFRASYSWYWGGIRVAVSTMVLAHQRDQIWVYGSSASPRGIGRLYPQRPRLQSVMRLTARGVEPLYFKASGAGANRDSDVMFDWVAGRAIGIDQGTRVDLPIPAGVQDDLSVQVAMLVQLLRGATPAKAFELDRNSVREYDYVREGGTMLRTSLGTVDTIVYAAHHPGSPRTTRFWCAPSLGYIPMQVQQKRLNDVEWTMQIESLQRG